MTESEQMAVYFNILQSVVVIIGVVIAVTQLFLMRTMHKENHAWNRRKATQEVIETANDKEQMSIMNFFPVHPESPTVPRCKIFNQFGVDEEFEQKLMRVLNYFERIAAGVHLGHYDEEMILKSQGIRFRQTYNKFQEYIESCQSETSEAYCEFSTLIKKWEHKK